MNDPSTPSGETAPIQRKKATYIGAPDCFALELAARHVAEAFGIYAGQGYGIYVVGSAGARPDWRDVDVVAIVGDDTFAALFPNAAPGHHENDARWLLLTVAISRWMSEQTGLPIDFKFQPQTWANEKHRGRRNAIGIRIRKEHVDG
jgi:hypothetical protein